MKCKKCGSNLEEDNRFCPNCGAKVEENTGWNCSCGNTNIQTKFCTNCGRPQPETANSAFDLDATVQADDFDKTVVIPKSVNIPVTPKKNPTGVLFSSRCEECGEMLTPDMKVCPNCGTVIKKDEDDEIIESETTVLVSSNSIFKSEEDLDATVVVNPAPTVNNENSIPPVVKPVQINLATCPNCGTTQDAEFIFCQKCGSKMAAKKVNPAQKSSSFCMNRAPSISGNALVNVCNNSVTLVFLVTVAVSVLVSLFSFFSHISLLGLVNLIILSLCCAGGWMVWYNAKQNKNVETPYTIIRVCMLLKMIGSGIIGVVGILLFIFIISIDSDSFGLALFELLLFGVMAFVLFTMYQSFKKTNEQVKQYALGQSPTIGPVSVPVVIYVMIVFLVIYFFIMTALSSVIAYYSDYLSMLSSYSDLPIDLSSFLSTSSITSTILLSLNSIVQYVCLILLLKNLNKQQ